MENELISPPRLMPYAGSKYRYLTALDYRFPPALKQGNIDIYIEPFLGSGSVLYYILANYQPKKAIVNDSNQQVINIHKQTLSNPVGLITYLNNIRSDMKKLEPNEDKMLEYVRSIPNKYLNRPPSYINSIEEAADTCFILRHIYSSMLKENTNGDSIAYIGKNKLYNWEERLNMSINGIEDIHNLVNTYTKYNNTMEFHNQKWEEFMSQTLSKYSNISPDKVFIYIDPPYIGMNEKGEIYMLNLYNTADSKFLIEDFKNLLNQMKTWSKQGYNVMFSHTESPYIDNQLKYTKYKPSSFTALYSITKTSKNENLWTNYKYY